MLISQNHHSSYQLYYYRGGGYFCNNEMSYLCSVTICEGAWEKGPTGSHYQI